MVAPISPREIYKLVENDKGEIMLIIYVRNQAPQNSTFLLNPLSGTLSIKRTPTDSLFIAGLALDAIEKLKKITELFICEIDNSKENKKESQIVRTYKAKKEQPNQTEQAAPQKHSQSVAEKAKSARSKVLNKSNK